MATAVRTTVAALPTRLHALLPLRRVVVRSAAAVRLAVAAAVQAVARSVVAVAVGRAVARSAVAAVARADRQLRTDN